MSGFIMYLEDSNFSESYVRLWDLEIPREEMAKLFVNGGDPDLGLLRLPVTLSG